jgi:uncharacterized membrane protein YeaQ/YmgE (transglycosylase-associated protein family)
MTALQRVRLGRQQPGIFFSQARKRQTNMNLTDVQLAPEVQEWVNVVLIWVGFGTLVGLMAKAVMPGRDPGGAVATLAMGVGGTVIGCSVLTYFSDKRITPVGPLGFVVATGGAFLLLFFYRLLAGRFFYEGDRAVLARPRARRRRVYTNIED